MINALSVPNSEARMDAACPGWLEPGFSLQIPRVNRHWLASYSPFSQFTAPITPELPSRPPLERVITL
jgi:hypothetical protein